GEEPSQILAVVILGEESEVARGQLDLSGAAPAGAFDIDAVREGRLESGGHGRLQDDGATPPLHSAEDDLSRSNALGVIKLELKGNAALDFRTGRVRALPFAEAQLVGNVGGQVAEGRQDDGDFRRHFEAA